MEPRIRTLRAADGVQIAYTTFGAGPTLIHLPGVPLSNLAAEWRIPVLQHAYEELGTHLRVVQYDGRGTGHSQRDVEDLSFEAFVLDLEAVVAEISVPTFSLLGFYSSCAHAIAYAARHPGRVSRLILFGGSARGWDPMSGQGTQALISLIERDWDTFAESATHAWLGWPDDEEGRLAADWFRTATTPEVARATMREASGVDVTDLLASVRCPVLVLHRAQSSVVPLATSHGLVAGLPDATLKILDGASESLFFQGADEVVAEIVGFVTGTHPGAAGSSGSALRGPVDRSPNRASSRGRPAGLTARELDVLRLIARGETNAEIGHQLGVSINTIERHVANLYRKIDARGRADATAYAIRRGLA